MLVAVPGWRVAARGELAAPVPGVHDLPDPPRHVIGIPGVQRQAGAAQAEGFKATLKNWASADLEMRSPQQRSGEPEQQSRPQLSPGRTPKH